MGAEVEGREQHRHGCRREGEVVLLVIFSCYALLCVSQSR